MLFNEIIVEYVFDISGIKTCILNPIKSTVFVGIGNGFRYFFNARYPRYFVGNVKRNAAQAGVEVIYIFITFKIGVFCNIIKQYFGTLAVGLEKRFGPYFVPHISQFFNYIRLAMVTMHIEIVYGVVELGVDRVQQCCNKRKFLLHFLHNKLDLFGIVAPKNYQQHPVSFQGIAYDDVAHHAFMGIRIVK